MKFLFVAAILVVAFVSAFTLYIFFSKPTAAASVLSGKEIAVRSLNFFNDMKRSDGIYYYSAHCNDISGCVKNNETYVQGGAWAVLAYAGVYEATGDQQYLQKMNSEAYNLMNVCNGNEDECMWILTQMITAYKISHNPNYLVFVENLGNRLMTNNDNTDVMMTGIEARQFALLYEVTNDTKYLNEARIRLQRSETAWNESVDDFNQPVYSSGPFTFYRFSCWTELGELEIARATDDSQAMANVTNFFYLANLGDNYKKLEQLTALHPCAETLLNLYEQSGNVQYLNEAKILMQYIVTYRWDSPLPQATKYNGDGGFLFNLYTGNDDKTLTDTGYMIYLLSQIPKENFTIVSWR